MRAILFTLLLIWTGQMSAQCAATWTSLTIGSHHFGHGDYEELNPGVGFEHVCGDWRRAGGVIGQNSQGNPSLYGGVAWMPNTLTYQELRAGLFVGLFSGYSKGLLPAAALVSAWEGRRYGLNLLWFPPYDEHKGVVILQVKRSF